VGSPWAERLQERYFGDSEHPYQTFERVVQRHLRSDSTLLDAGCGRTAPVLRKYRGRASRLIGVDRVDFREQIDGIELCNGDLAQIPLPDKSVDLIMVRSVMEHVADPDAVYREFRRVLKPEGTLVLLTGNLWDYSAWIARLVPNRFHPWIVARVQGRAEIDVFPVQYRTNTRATITRQAVRAGFDVEEFEYLGQYPCYFMFSGPLFLLATAYEKLISRVELLAFLRGWLLVTLRAR